MSSLVSGLHEIVEKMRSDIVRELELVLHRELSGNFEKLEAVVREMHSLDATGVDLNISTSRQQADPSLDAHLDPSIGKRRAGDADNLALSTSFPREADKKIEDRFMSYFQRLEDLGINYARLSQPKLEVPTSKPSEPHEILEDASDSESPVVPHEASTMGGQDEILKVVERGHKEVLQLYLEKKLDPNLILHNVKLDHHSKTFSHCSLLALAVLVGRRSQVRLLVSMKASIESTYGFLVGTESRDWSGPAVTATVARNDIPMFKLLLESRADLAAEASNGADCIWQCCYFGSHEILGLCLSSVDVSAKTLNKTAEFRGIWYSPLHVSVVMGQENCSRLLLAAKAPIDLKNEQKETPLDAAIHFCHPDLVTLLVKEGARITERQKKTGADGRTSVASTPSRDTLQSLPSRWTHGGIASAISKQISKSTTRYDVTDFIFKGFLAQLFAERNPVLVLAIARGLQSQPEQVQTLAPAAILEFWLTDASCMSAILEAMFAERHLRFKSKDAGVKEHKTAIVRKNDSLKDSSFYKHKIVVSSRYCYNEFSRLHKKGGEMDDGMKNFVARLTPQKLQDVGATSCISRTSDLRHVPIIVHECLVPNIHNDLLFLKGFANAGALDHMYLNPHCQAIIKHTWDRVLKLAVMHCFVHFTLLVFYLYVAVKRNLIRFHGVHKATAEYEEINVTVQWIALMLLPFWLFQLVAECIEFAAHIEYGWTLEFLIDARNAVDFSRILVDGAVVLSFIFWGFDPTEDLYFRAFLAAVCAVKWTKMLFCLTPFRRIGLPVIPILFTLSNILTSVAIMFVYFSGLAHGMIALDVLPYRFTFTFLHSAMFGVSSDLGEVKEMNNPNGQEDFKSWWLQLLLLFITFGLPITFMNIFIAAMSSSYELGITHREELFQNRCAEASFGHACVSHVFKKLRGHLRKEREERLWYCRDRSDD